MQDDIQAIQENFRRIREEVDLGGGFKTYTAGELRDAVGNDRLGTEVAKDIRKHLESFGLVCTKLEVSKEKYREWLEVRVYVIGGWLDMLTNFINSPGHRQDEELRNILDSCTSSRKSEIKEKLLPAKGEFAGSRRSRRKKSLKRR